MTKTEKIDAYYEEEERQAEREAYYAGAGAGWKEAYVEMKGYPRKEENKN